MERINVKIYNLLFALLIGIVAFGVTACGGDDEDDNSTPSNNNQSQTYELEAVDLGLSVRWANMNVGATTPWDFGSYFAWGETTEKDTYTETNYANPGVDRISANRYDAAFANMEGPWRIPTEREIQELLEKCTYTSATLEGVKGAYFTASNGNSIFLPAAGWKIDKASQAGEQGGYWAGTGSGKCGLLIAGEFIRLYTNWTPSTGMTVRGVME